MNGMSQMSYPNGYMAEIDDRSKNIELAATIVQDFERKAVNGGKLELEIDRYGHIKCVMTINSPGEGSA